MSLFALQTSFGSLKPKVWVRGDHLHARTSYPVQALTLFSYARKLHVDRQQRIVELETVHFWLLNQRRIIPFDRVAFINCTYRDLGTSWGWTDTGFGRTDKWEQYAVSLLLKNPTEQVKLFNFCGEGKVMSGRLGVLYGGDELIDTYGDQAEHFGFFMAKLREFLQVPVGRRETVAVKDKQDLEYQCSVCKRTSLPGRDKCWMCGSPVEPVIPTEAPEAEAGTDSGDEPPVDSPATSDARTDSQDIPNDRARSRDVDELRACSPRGASIAKVSQHCAGPFRNDGGDGCP